MTRWIALLILSTATALAPACGAEGDGGDMSGGGGGGGGGGGALMATGEGPCERPDECEGGVCVELIDGDNPPNYCTQECGSCPDGFVCDSNTFALVGLSFCRFGDDASEPTPSEEPPRLPCTDDSDCDFGVCAEYGGERGCTQPCEVEEDCVVELQGIVLDLATCAADPTPGQDRTVCLPDPACYPDLLDCITTPF